MTKARQTAKPATSRTEKPLDHRLRRLRVHALRSPIDNLHPAPATKSVVLDCGWGRLLFAQTFDSNRMSLYRSIYYTGVNDPALEAQVKRATEQSPYFDEITQLLDEYDVTTPQRTRRDPRQLTLSPPVLELKRLKNTVGSLLGRYKFGPTITSAAQ